MTSDTDVHDLTEDELLPLMVANEYRNRQRRRGHVILLNPFPPCTVCQESVQEQTISEPVKSFTARLVVNWPCGHRLRFTLQTAERLMDLVSAIADQGERRPAGSFECSRQEGFCDRHGFHRHAPDAAQVDPTATEATELDKERRYLRPVRATPISDNPDGVHLALYQWIPRAEAWATGPGICGESMSQGPLPEGTQVTCAGCLARQEDYERYLAPGYRPEDDDPKALRARLARVRAEVAMLCECCGDNRERMARIKRELGLDEEGAR
jgi:hypothetical protein